MAAEGEPVAESFRTIANRLRRERGWSVEELAFEVWSRRDVPNSGASISLIQKRLARGSHVRPSPELMRAIATALDVDPTTFVEYRLASARAQLDEQVVGLSEALARLALVEGVLLAHDPARGTR